MTISSAQVIKTLREMADPDIAEHSQRFFKTGKGEYGEGDRFLGIRVPALRKCVKAYREISLKENVKLLKSPFHEARMLALLVFVAQYASTDSDERKALIYRSYLNRKAFVNNWDLVDCSAEHIVGAHLFSRNRKPIYRLAGSRRLWDRRIAVMSTFHFVKRADFVDTLAVAELLLYDSEDLIHKAVGWMLREVGKRNRDVEERFLSQYYRKMPRTMLRYAIEKFPESERLAYLQGRK